MKMYRANVNCDGLTLVELLLVIAIIILLVALIGIPEPRAKNKALLIQCMNNQRQVAIGFIVWQGDNTNQFPWQVSSTNNGTMEASAAGEATPNYHALLAYIHQSSIFVCPTDPAKTVATNQAKVSNENISYFVGLDTLNTNQTAGILTGDRHLKAGETAVRPGLFVHSNNATMNWTLELHGYNPNKPAGVMSFDDGHCEAVFGTNTDFVFRNEGLATSRFDVP
jgi:type II secretory pathway pseudopilin PulG